MRTLAAPDRGLLQAAVTAAEAAYAAEPDTWLMARGWRWAVLYADKGAEAVVADDGRRRFVAFRGTELAHGRAIPELWINLRSTLTPGPDGAPGAPADWSGRKAARGHVHAGYWRQLWRIWPDVLAHARRCAPPVYATGWSMGGALAALAASMFRFDGVISFGAPRPGTAAFCARLRPPVDRIVMPDDFAPAFPCLFGIPVPGYAQPGREWRLTDDGRLMLVDWLPLAPAARQDLGAHDLDAYAAAIRRG